MHLGPFHSAQTLRIELGEEPPLRGYEGRSGMSDRRQVSLRWFAGTVLTGVTSLVLMGGALMAALDGQYSVEAAPSSGAFLNGFALSSGGAKGDRVLRTAAEYSSKHVIDVNVVTREGDRDHIRVQPHVFVSATLATRKDPELAERIPPFNPLNMFADNNDDDGGISVAETGTPLPADSIYGAKLESEVSISLAPFPSSSGDIDLDRTPSETEVELAVRETARTLSIDAVEMAAKSLVDPGRFDFNLALQPDLERYAVRITPENVSFVSKQDEDIRFAGMDESIVPVTKDQDLVDVMMDYDATEDEALAISTAFSSLFGISDLTEGQRLRIAYAPSPDDLERMRPERVSLYENTEHRATVARSDSGAYIEAKEPSTFLADAFEEADRVSYGGPTPAIYDSLYQTALEQDMPEEIINDLVRMFSFDVDFNARVQPGDALELFFTDGDDNSPPKILYAALNTGNTTREFYRFRTPDDGVTDFYDDTGQSAKKFLIRKPLNGGKFRSGFGMRRHPIHGYTKMHRGVDWSASRGTPIMAAGNGTIVKAGWSSGYGRRIELQHTNGYTTTYNHMSGFGSGIREGSKVTQGQIIGYVGSTGLSTGPHLHYEVLVNGRYMDPMRIKLPKGRTLDGEMRTAFETERYRVDTLLDRVRKPSRIAAIN
ncbi:MULTISPECIES: M23 family metallopeptidase [Stappiaceae]|jgi:murein DD-endopeptidase MepM/ murein hydrolase activator NlpD|uniref:Glycyl-glycine endopeptidase ALE-1 n=2 Tax=Roseibium TaxID=150830 RepID=A0A0M6Y741_9HYPH|nr:MULTISPECIES: M23 family metallopeptidase [Stappiaceae]AMN51658.1 peptidase M23 [Labrenzia sp. CP4]MBO9462073.1 M23 family metallopeptidase [Labrenzia sp. R5_0]NKI61250.1 M23 family metallopeptidase [Labrenzia sp. PO1]WJS03540.1 M23 family metallopeptidase [Roseibium aggregatum]CTQ45926.1 Glycyl-glycine endopeptidase ALE-1 precursor [Roseibium aggregatum]